MPRPLAQDVIARLLAPAPALVLALTVALALLASPGTARGQDSAAPSVEPQAPAPPAASVEPDDAPVEEVVVSGEQPGPPLWKVSRGDHTLYILGTLAPLPRDFTWRSREVESVIARSQSVLGQESINTNIGFFRGMTLLPSALRARKNPDGAQLKDVLSPDVYKRWTALKATYIGRDNSIEGWRPMVAGAQLYREALDKSRLKERGVVWPQIRKLAKKYDVKVKVPEVEFDVQDPKGNIKSFTETPRDVDVACFIAVLDRLETDLGPMKARASAWAMGDVDALERMRIPARENVCLDAVTSTPRLQKEFAQIRARAQAEWFAAAEDALAKNTVTFGVLPMAELLSPTGRLAQLEQKGYEVERP